jgi:SAM-dependent methyltransferase
MPSALISALDKALYPGLADNWDDALLREAILPYLRPEHVVLDLGSGAGIVPHVNFRGMAARVCGVDPDRRVMLNCYLDEAVIGSGECIPYPACHFDLVFANNVLEHLEDPRAVFAEVRRVLKPGGLFIVKTANALHYVPLVARMTPHWAHESVGRWKGRRDSDTFPTFYRANTHRMIRRHAFAAGMLMESCRAAEGRPEYARISALTYIPGWIYEKLVNSSTLLAWARVVLICALRKPLEIVRAQE